MPALVCNGTVLLLCYLPRSSSASLDCPHKGCCAYFVQPCSQSPLLADPGSSYRMPLLSLLHTLQLQGGAARTHTERKASVHTSNTAAALLPDKHPASNTESCSEQGGLRGCQKGHTQNGERVQRGWRRASKWCTTATALTLLCSPQLLEACQQHTQKRHGPASVAAFPVRLSARLHDHAHAHSLSLVTLSLK